MPQSTFPRNLSKHGYYIKKDPRNEDGYFAMEHSSVNCILRKIKHYPQLEKQLLGPDHKAPLPMHNSAVLVTMTISFMLLLSGLLIVSFFVLFLCLPMMYPGVLLPLVIGVISLVVLLCSSTYMGVAYCDKNKKYQKDVRKILEADWLAYETLSHHMYQCQNSKTELDAFMISEPSVLDCRIKSLSLPSNHISYIFVEGSESPPKSIT